MSCHTCLKHHNSTFVLIVMMELIVSSSAHVIRESSQGSIDNVAAQHCSGDTESAELSNDDITNIDGNKKTITEY